MLPWVPDVQRFRAEHQLVVPLVYLPNVSGVIRHTEIGERRGVFCNVPVHTTTWQVRLDALDAFLFPSSLCIQFGGMYGLVQ